jgi:3D (Asp-Asp-Asp) domain-containing protein
MRPIPFTLAVATALAAAMAALAPAAVAGEPGRLLGTFQLTYYFVAEEERAGSWPLFTPGCSRVIALTSETFHHALSLEGTGRLRDGRLINYSEDCGCARAGNRGRRICYEEVDPVRYPWGMGARMGESHARLEPFRSVAVDPALVAVGTVVFSPEWRGGRWPDGSARDGCFRAEDSGTGVRGRHVDLFAGKPGWAKQLQEREIRQVRLYADSPLCRHLSNRLRVVQ